MSREQGSGNVITEDRDVSDFDSVQLACSGDLTLIQGNTESLTIEAEDNVMSQIKTEVNNGQLIIKWDPPFFGGVEPTIRIKFQLNAITITGLSISGDSTINSASLDTSSLDLNLSGGSYISLTSPAGGVVDSQNIRASGSGNYDAPGLESQNVTVNVSSSSKVTVWATQTLDVKASGSGQVYYVGNPTITGDTDHVSPAP